MALTQVAILDVEGGLHIATLCIFGNTLVGLAEGGSEMWVWDLDTQGAFHGPEGKRQFH
jgi:hypothetical protein